MQQAAKTYLERHFESLPMATVDELISHGLKSLQACLQDGEITSANSSIAIVGKDMSFTILENSALDQYVALLSQEDVPMAVEAVAAEPEPAPEEGAAPAAVEPQEPQGAGGGEEDGPRPMEI